MGDTNYFSGAVKLLEKPLQKVNKEKIIKSEFRGELYQTRQNKIISLIFWGNLAHDVNNYYQINDYILIEGYTSIEKKYLDKENQKLTKLVVTVLKVYPILLNSTHENKKH